MLRHCNRYLFLIIIILPFSLGGETVFLKNGSIIQGKIIQDGAVTVIKQENGGMGRYNRNDVLRVLYDEFYPGKVYIKKTDGSSLEAVIVDEDQLTYTLRKGLSDAKEFKINKKEIQFTSRKNPVGLEGEPTSDGIFVSWNPPYSKVKTYRVYLCGEKGEYTLYRETSDIELMIRGLNENSVYFIKVTAVDINSVESEPSNEIKIMTGIYPPRKLSVTKVIKEDSMTAKLNWQPADVSAGKVKEYRVYKMEGKKAVLVGATTITTYDVKNLVPGNNYNFSVSTLNDLNFESGRSPSESVYKIYGLTVTAAPVFIFPAGNLTEILHYGYGAMLYVTKDKLITDNCEMGLCGGYWVFDGASRNVEKASMVPFLAHVKYSFTITNGISLNPFMSIGASWNSYSGKEKYAENAVSESALEPLLLAGADCSWNFAGNFYASLGAGGGFIFERISPLYFLQGEVSIGWRF